MSKSRRRLKALERRVSELERLSRITEWTAPPLAPAMPIDLDPPAPILDWPNGPELVYPLDDPDEGYPGLYL